MGARPYIVNGFRLDGPLEAGDTYQATLAAVTVAKGEALHDNGAGLATNATTPLAATFMGIAGEPGTSGASIMVIRPNQKLSFWVANSSATVAAQTDIGETVDLGSGVVNKIDVTDNTVVEWGLRIVEIDISAPALAANAGGFVRGFFEKQPQ